MYLHINAEQIHCRLKGGLLSDVPSNGLTDMEELRPVKSSKIPLQ